MSFNSIPYFLLLGVVFVVYWRIPLRAKNVLLLVASYVFYGAWDWRFLGLLALSTLIDYGVGLALHGTDDERSRRLWLATSVVANLGILGFFKYFNFFVDGGVELFRAIGLDGGSPVLEVVLPVGISFYTFQSLSYTIDIYRRELTPTRDLVDYAAFVSFFPQLVAGPIERARRLLPQISHDRRFPDSQQLSSGLALILVGLFKKVAIADVMAPLVEEAFGGASTASGLTVLVGVYAFALQIYGDFSGYTDIARGSARLLGIELMVNFREPYLSRSITEFWRTWHISLSTWLRDYLYVPLGGNRRGTVRTSVNLMVVMLLGGLWHGASWTFVAWGAIHGTYLVVERAAAAAGRRTHRHPMRVVPGALTWLVTFQLVCLAWIFFRAETFTQAGQVLEALLTRMGGPVASSGLVLLGFGAMATLLLDLANRRTESDAPLVQLGPAWRGATIALLALGIIVFAGGTPVPFLYFQF